MTRLPWALALVAAVPAAAQPALVRLGAHDGFGRVVFEFSEPQAFTTERDGQAVILHFPGGGAIPDAAGSVRNVVAVTGGGDMATITIAPNARLRVVKMGNRVVVDVMDPPHPAPAVIRPARTASKSPEPVAPRAPQPPTLPPPAMIPPPPAPVNSAREPAPPAPAEPPRPAPAAAPERTLALAMRPLSAPPDVHGSAALLPFAADIGAAAFRHGDEAWVVFDERRSVDVGPMASDPMFGGAVVEMLPSATLLRLRAIGARSVRLERVPDGWSVLCVETAGAQPVVMPSASPSSVHLNVASAGSVVVVPDAETGRNLLVGTIRAAGPGVPVPFRVPEFAVLPSWQGIVVEPVSDRTVLRSVPAGFVIETGGVLSPLPEDGVALANAAVLTRQFDFPAQPVATLLRRLQSQVEEERQSPPQARVGPRKAVAQTMLSLGLDAEAQALVRVALAEDPRAAADADLGALGAIAALMSGRPQEAGALDSPALSGTDEVTFWRAVRRAMPQEGSAEAAQQFASTASLALAYPPALRNRLLPLAAEAMVAGGATAAADALLAHQADEPLLAFARAMRSEQKGDVDPALTVYDALASGRDRLASARAATRAVLLRLNTGKIGVADAADALERTLDRWRGDGRERDVRLQTATLEAQAGRWRKAFDLLRETGQLFPDDALAVAQRVTALLGDLLHGPGAASIPPLDLAALAEENADVIGKADAPGMALLLADKLMALDLPQRAARVLDRLIAAAGPGADRAALGSRLAAIRLDEGDAEGARSALAATDADALPPALREERDMQDARIRALRHDTAGAAAVLSRVGTPAAADLRAKILADGGDWHGAALALAEIAARVLPETGSLNPAQQDLVLRLASAQSRAGDQAALQLLGTQQMSRMSEPRLALLRLLTAAPITNPADVRRVTPDIATARAMPTTLAAIGGR